MFSSPYTFPCSKYIRIDQFTFEIQQKPTIAKIEMCIVTVGVHQIVHFRIQYLNQRSMKTINFIECERAKIKIRLFQLNGHKQKLRPTWHKLPHICKMHIHCASIWKVLDHTFHQTAKASIAKGFIVENNQKWGNKITHSLHVANFKMFPHITKRNKMWKILRLKPYNFIENNKSITCKSHF